MEAEHLARRIHLYVWPQPVSHPRGNHDPAVGVPSPSLRQGSDPEPPRRPVNSRRCSAAPPSLLLRRVVVCEASGAFAVVGGSSAWFAQFAGRRTGRRRARRRVVRPGSEWRTRLISFDGQRDQAVLCGLRTAGHAHPVLVLGPVRAVAAGHRPPRPGPDLGDQLVDTGADVQTGRHLVIQLR